MGGKGRSVFVDMTRHAPTRSFRDESQRGKGALSAGQRELRREGKEGETLKVK